MTTGISPAFTAFLSQPYQTLAAMLKITRADGVVLAITTHDQDITYPPSGGVTYIAIGGGALSDTEITSALAVNNASWAGALSSSVISTEDIKAGLYDYADCDMFMVNYEDLSMGRYSLGVSGKLGAFTTDLNAFSAELRGRMQMLTRTLGRLCAPLCPWVLGDAHCTKHLAAFTVTGTLSAVSADNATMFDPARTEPGAPAGPNITGISNANPGVVTLATALDAPNGSAVTLSGIVGPALLNTVTVVRGLSGDGLTFQLSVDTSDTAAYPPYVSGGVVTPIGGNSGYFDYGLFTANSGLAAGRSMEVKSYVPGQWTLQLPMPYRMVAGDTYTLIAGCNKQIGTCHTKFSNHLNFGGDPYVPGQDKVVQIGRQN